MRLPDMAVRCLAWLCLFLTLWPGFVAAAGAPAPAAVPVVTNVSGAVVVRSASGVSRDVISSRIIHTGDTIVTGIDSLAVLNLADVGSVRLGPGSMATTSSTSSSLAVNLNAGSSCAQALTSAITIKAGGLAIAAGGETAIFNLINDANGITIAAYQGQISITPVGKSPTILHAGEAATSSHGGNPVQVPLQTVQPQFAALKCPDDEIIARAMPSPPPSGGHAGGGAGFLGILLGIGAIAALAGGHGGGGGGGGGGTPASPTPPPTGSLQVNPTALTFNSLGAGANQTFKATETNFVGSITVSSADSTIASVSPASATNTPSGVTFTVTPVKAGNTSITIVGSPGQTQTLAVSVAPFGALNVTALQPFTDVGAANSQTATIHEDNYAGSFNTTGTAACSGIASIGAPSGTGPTATLPVTPTGSGTCSFSVTDNHSGTFGVNVTVGPFGALQPSPNSFNFHGTTTPQTFRVTEQNYTGSVTATIDHLNIATVTPGGAQPIGSTFTVTPGVAGSATITLTDDHGQTKTVPVNVSSGLLQLSPSSLTFHTPTSPLQTFTASETLFTPPFTLDASDCSGQASVAVGPVSGNSQTFSVTPQAPTSAACMVKLSDGGANTNTLLVTVEGPLTVSTNNVAVNGVGQSTTFSASEVGLLAGALSASTSGNITINPSSGPGPGPVIFRVTGTGATNTATVTVTDGVTPSKNQTVAVTVFGALAIDKASVSFVNPTSPAQTVNASELFFPGSLSVDDNGCNGIADATPASGPSPLAISITPTPSTLGGNCSIVVTDGHGGSKTIAVTVVGSVTVDHPSLTFASPTAGSQNVKATELEYAGTLTATSSNCTGIVTFAPSSGSSPFTFTVTPASGNNGGNCTISVSDDHGGSAQVSVVVQAFGTLTVTPKMFTFTDIGASANKAFAVKETSYTGVFGVANNTCGPIANVAPPSSGGPNATITVTPTASNASPCTFDVTDDHGGSVTVTVHVGPFGLPAPNPTSLTLNTGGSASGSFAVSESGYTGQFTAAGTGCSGVATFNAGPATTFNVTASGAGNCKITVSDDQGPGVNSASVNVFVTAGTISVSPLELQLTVGPGSAGSFTATDSACIAGDLFSVTDNGAVTITAPAAGSTFDCSVVETFTVTSIVANGQGSVSISDPHGGSAVVSVGVGSSTPLVKRRHPVQKPIVQPVSGRPIMVRPLVGPRGGHPQIPSMLTISASHLSLTVAQAPGAITVSEPGYSGAFTVSVDNPRVAQVLQLGAPGPQHTFTISALSAGTTIIRFSDANGQAQLLTVTVAPRGVLGIPAKGKVPL